MFGADRDEGEIKERLMSCGLSADSARPGELLSSGVLLSKKVISLGLLGFFFSMIGIV